MNLLGLLSGYFLHLLPLLTRKSISISTNQCFFPLQSSQLWQKGWPLTLSNGALVLHLGTIDESLVRLQDFYLCIRSGASNVSSGLYACWRTSLSDSIVYHELDPEKREFASMSFRKRDCSRFHRHLSNQIPLFQIPSRHYQLKC
jgi:hypothetical protein